MLNKMKSTFLYLEPNFCHKVEFESAAYLRILRLLRNVSCHRGRHGAIYNSADRWKFWRRGLEWACAISPTEINWEKRAARRDRGLGYAYAPISVRKQRSQLPKYQRQQSIEHQPYLRQIRHLRNAWYSKASHLYREVDPLFWEVDCAVQDFTCSPSHITV